ncbi:ribosomal protein L7/L12 [Streptomyces sp. NPDC001480]|uniref:ribosomal protein L7/L12 n=1 Tax=Streptomyces sp. NPDC001480 TaxID=3364577 RepID=UPI003676CE2D
MAAEYVTLVCDGIPNGVVLTDPGDRVLDVIQVVRRLTGLSLWRSKLLVTQAPTVVLEGRPREDAEAAIVALRATGAEAEIRARTAHEWRSDMRA